ncbi:MAG: tetratricopeptide repeat protein [PVC group bacterium]
MIRYLKKEWICLGLIGLATVAAYGNSFQVPFIYDDANQIVESALIKNPAYIPRLFTSEYYKLSPKRFRPVTVLFYFIQYAFWRLNPWGYHLFKLLLHLVNVILLFCYLRLLNAGSAVSLLASALFALHPAHVETITCVSFLDDPLMFFWFMLSLIAATRAARSPRRPWAWTVLSLVFYLLALASKEPALVLPLWLALQFLVERFPGVTRRRGFYLGFIAISLAWVIVRFFLLEKEGWMMISTGKELGPVNAVAATYLHYLRVAVLPVNLCLDYVYPLSHGVFALPENFLFPLALAGAMIILSCVRRSRLLLLGWGWFILALFPVANAINQPRLAADRYLYLPLAGFSLAAAVLIIKTWGWFKNASARIISVICLVLLFVCWGVLIRMENFLWSDPRLFWEDVLRTSPLSATALNNLGSLHLSGRKPAVAEAEFRKALESRPPDEYRAVILTNLGLALWERGMEEESVKTLLLAAGANPDYAPAAYELGKIYVFQRKYDVALDAFRRALELTPYDHVIYDHLAGFHASQGQWKEAEEYARKAVYLNPDFAIGYDHLGVIYANRGRGEDARRCWRKALELDQNLESARQNLSAAK